MYVNKVKNRVTFKTKNGYSLKLLTLETMNLLEDKNDENVAHLES